MEAPRARESIHRQCHCMTVSDVCLCALSFHCFCLHSVCVAVYEHCACHCPSLNEAFIFFWDRMNTCACDQPNHTLTRPCSYTQTHIPHHNSYAACDILPNHTSSPAHTNMFDFLFQRVNKVRPGQHKALTRVSLVYTHLKVGSWCVCVSMCVQDELAEMCVKKTILTKQAKNKHRGSWGVL